MPKWLGGTLWRSSEVSKPPSCPYSYVKIGNAIYKRDTRSLTEDMKVIRYCDGCGVLYGNAHHVGCGAELCAKHIMPVRLSHTGRPVTGYTMPRFYWCGCAHRAICYKDPEDSLGRFIEHEIIGEDELYYGWIFEQKTSQRSGWLRVPMELIKEDEDAPGHIIGYEYH